MAVERPHIRFPFTRGGPRGTVNVVEQDTAEHVLSCVQVIVYCPLGYRPERPEFGWRFPLFQNEPVSTASLQNAIQEFEPRASTDVSEYEDAIQAATEHLSVELGVSDG